jgi:hypothetical protein
MPCLCGAADCPSCFPSSYRLPSLELHHEQYHEGDFKSCKECDLLWLQDEGPWRRKPWMVRRRYEDD